MEAEKKVYTMTEVAALMGLTRMGLLGRVRKGEVQKPDIEIRAVKNTVRLWYAESVRHILQNMPPRFQRSTYRGKPVLKHRKKKVEG